jgi:SET domain-containing protein
VRRREPPSVIWAHDDIVVAPSPIEGRGLYASADLRAGQVLIRLAGRLVSSSELGALIEARNTDPEIPYVDSVTVYSDEHLVLPPGSLVHFGNHSCDPNLWHVGPYEIAARRPIAAGEELTIDYGTSSGAAGFSMRCACGVSGCRGEVTSGDWRRPELQERYGGHFVPALEERIRRSW